MTQAEEPRLERVVVLEGGISSEREVSLLSGRGVKEALASKGLEVESWDRSRGGSVRNSHVIAGQALTTMSPMMPSSAAMLMRTAARITVKPVAS